MTKKKINPIIVILIIIGFLFIARQRGFFGAVGPSGELMIMDLESMTTTVLADNWHYISLVSFPDDITQFPTYHKNLGELDSELKQWNFFDKDSYTPAVQAILMIGESEEGSMIIPQGHIVTLIYDGGQNLNVYLPEYDTNSRTILYISSTGETYYDADLTQDACTIANGCIGGCIEDWSCTTWSDCISNQKTRTCTDNNNCGTTVNKPSESQSCDECSTPGDTPPSCDGIDNAELGSAISSYISGSMDRTDLGLAIQSWVGQ